MCCSAWSTSLGGSRSRCPSARTHLPPFDRDASHFAYDRWHGWWQLDRDGNAPAYPFGFGLGYTTFELGEASAVVGDDAIGIRTTLRNTGSRRGTDVVQIYSADPPRLVGFARARVGPGETAELAISVPFETLAVRDVERHAMVVRPGTYELRVARSAVDEGIGLTVTVSSAA